MQQRIASLAALVIGAMACSSTLTSDTPSDGASGASPTAPGMAGAGAVDETGSELPSVSLGGKPIRSRLVRLTHEQWEHSVRDLLQLDADPGLSSSFTGDPPNGTFSNNERALSVTPNLQLDYQRAAEALSQRVASD